MAQNVESAGRLEITLDHSAAPVADASYSVTLCGTPLFQAGSARALAGDHHLGRAIAIGSGQHELVVAGSSGGEDFESRYPVAVPLRTGGYQFGTVHCHIRGPEDHRHESGFQLQSASAPSFTSSDLDHRTACSVRG
jgi:hypothetical protein